MQSRNPIFTRRGAGGQQPWSTPTPTVEQLNAMYGAPSYAPPTAGRAMTIDDVVVRGFMTLGTLVVSAALAWYFNAPMALALPAVLVGMVLALIVSFKRSTNPALILGYAVCYGVAIGIISHVFESVYNGIVLQAVLGTMVAFGGTLAVYALKIFRPTPKFTKFVIAAGFAAIGLMILNMIAGIFVSGGLGLRTDSPLGWIFSLAMILLGCFFLLLDFSEVEQGVQAGVPERYSWLMAFGLTLSLVWLYLEILRFISYLSSSE